MTPCECPVAGYCNRHKLKKNEHLHKLCATDQRYYDHWEAVNSLVERPQPVQSTVYNHWAPLHYYAVKHWDNWDKVAAKKWYRKWKLGIPKTGCGCAGNWKQETGKYPPVFTSAEAFFQWAWLVHDAVNERLDKPRPSLAECYRIWIPE